MREASLAVVLAPAVAPPASIDGELRLLPKKYEFDSLVRDTGGGILNCLEDN